MAFGYQTVLAGHPQRELEHISARLSITHQFPQHKIFSKISRVSPVTLYSIACFELFVKHFLKLFYHDVVKEFHLLRWGSANPRDHLIPFKILISILLYVCHNHHVLVFGVVGPDLALFRVYNSPPHAPIIKCIKI